jgi:hypothetical protein
MGKAGRCVVHWVKEPKVSDTLWVCRHLISLWN